VGSSQFYNPYVGPRPFEREEKNRFFGREREISELQSLLTAHRTLLLYAASGTGKTSLLNAGLVPLMEQEGFEIFPIARVSGLIPGGVRPEDISNIYVFNTLMGWTEDEEAYKTLPRMSLAEFLKAREHSLDSEGFPAPRLIIFDQFEELFTLYQEHWKQREDFFHQVAKALEEDPVLRVLFVMREDYLAKLDPYVSLLLERLRARYRLVRLRFEDACYAVEGPLKGSGRSFANGVVTRLVGELLKTKVESVTGETVEAVGEYVEPVQLQIVCRNLWDSLPADVTVITSGHLHAFGDVDEALKGFYENAVQKTTSETTAKEEELRRWFAHELITPAGTRGTVYRGKEDTAGISNAAVDILENEHILRGEMRAGAHWYELTHDRLIEPIRNSNEIWLPDFEVEQARLRARKKLRKYLNVGVPVVLVFLTVLTIGSIIMYYRAQEARVQAEKAQIEAVQAQKQEEKALKQEEEARVQEGLARVQAEQERQRTEETRLQAEDLAEKLRQVIDKKQPLGSLQSCELKAEALKKAVFDPQKDLRLPNGQALNPRDQITLEAWFCTERLGARQAIIYKPYTLGAGGEPYYQYNLELRQTGQLYFALAINQVRRYIDGAFLVDPKKWYHVAATYDGNIMQLYLCGKGWKKPYPVKGNLSNYPTPLDIGVGKKGSGNPDRPFKGSLAEVRIWNIARKGAQIRADMHKTISATEGLLWGSTTDGNFWHNSVTHTEDEYNSWWQLQLPSTAMIQKIVIWNRTDPCCRKRLSNLRISVLGDSKEEVWGVNFPGPIRHADFELFEVHPPVRGRFVKVQILGKNLENTGVLSLAEVQVFGNFTK
jgi:hypothetical protein